MRERLGRVLGEDGGAHRFLGGENAFRHAVMQGWRQLREVCCRAFSEADTHNVSALDAFDVREAGVVQDVRSLAGPGRLRSRAGCDPKPRPSAQLVRRSEELAQTVFIGRLPVRFQLEQVDEDGFDGADCGVDSL